MKKAFGRNVILSVLAASAFAATAGAQTTAPAPAPVYGPVDTKAAPPAQEQAQNDRYRLGTLPKIKAENEKDCKPRIKFPVRLRMKCELANGL